MLPALTVAATLVGGLATPVTMAASATITPAVSSTGSSLITPDRGTCITSQVTLPGSPNPGSGCLAVAPAPHAVAGHQVGITQGQITSATTVPDVHGHAWTEADLALSGTAAGYVETTGAPRSDLVDYPRFLFPQFGDISWSAATTGYSGAGPGAGNGLTLLWPRNKADWNGQVVVVSPGQQNDPPIGALVPRAGQGLDPGTFGNLYAGPLIDAHYAVLYDRRQASGGLTATLADGSTRDTSLNDNVAAYLDWIRTGIALLQRQLGRAPSIVLAYAHSAGVILNRLLNWSGANDKPGGGHYIDGFVSDDPGGGEPLPLDMPEGSLLGFHAGQVTYPASALLTKAEQHQAVPEATLLHTEYTATHSWEPDANYLALKRAGQAAFRKEPGIWPDKETDAEVANVSHIANQAGSPPHTLDLEGTVLAVVSDMDAKVIHGTPLPAPLDDLTGGNAQPPLGVPAGKPLSKAIELPAAACPTRFYFGDPVGGDATETGAVAFDGRSAEPITAGGQLVDVDGNGVRDTMLSLDQAWQRLHLVDPHHSVTRQVYVACVRSDVAQLEHARLLTMTVGNWYDQHATEFPTQPW